MSLRTLLGCCVAIVLFASSGPPSGAIAQDAPTPATIVAGLAQNAGMPAAYSADVKLHVKLRMFPFIGVTVRGTSTYRRPGLYHFVFRGFPQAAEKFNDMRYDLGDPLSWPQRYDLALAPQSTVNAPVLRLTPRIRGLVATLDVTTDPQAERIVKAVWTRWDGGVITLTQTFSPVGSAQLVSRQVATVDIPHMRAELTADYSDFALDQTAAGP